MKFEHLIQINELNNPFSLIISRQQLWRGLLIRAESPELFIDHLEACQLSHHEKGFHRELDFGTFQLKDTVHVFEAESIVYDVPAQGEIVASRLIMKIEEPEPNELFVRFTYDDFQSAAQDKANEMATEFKKSAYFEQDIDTIRRIRQMAENHQLNIS